MKMSLGEKALLGAIVALLVLLLAFAAAYMEAVHEKKALKAKLKEAAEESKRLIAEKRSLEKRIGELEAENKELKGEVERLNTEIGGLRKRLMELEGEVEALRGRLGEEESKSSIYNLLFSQPLVVLGRLNASMRVALGEGFADYIVTVRLPESRGEGTVFVAVAQVDGRLEKAWVVMKTVNGSGEVRVEVPLHSLSVMKTVVYVGVAERRGVVYFVYPPDVVVGPVNVDVEESSTARCMVLDIRAAYRGSGKKAFFQLVAEVGSGLASNKVASSLVIMESGVSYKLGSGSAICVKKWADVVVAILPLPLPAEG